MNFFSSEATVETLFSSTADGTMAIDGGWDNRIAFLERHGFDPQRTVHAGLCHGVTTQIVGRRQFGTVIPATDGLITAEANVTLAITAADCLLVYAVDPITNVIGLVHAGRKGLAEQVLQKFIQTWQQHFSMDGRSVLVAIGPHICARHYPVQAPEAVPFAAYHGATQATNHGVELDLLAVAKQQLMGAGIVAENITTDGRCTFEDPQLFSYRRDHPDRPRLQLGVIRRRAT